MRKPILVALSFLVLVFTGCGGGGGGGSSSTPANNGGQSVNQAPRQFGGHNT